MTQPDRKEATNASSIVQQGKQAQGTLLQQTQGTRCVSGAVRIAIVGNAGFRATARPRQYEQPRMSVKEVCQSTLNQEAGLTFF